ncbi:MAG: ParA family partition ATPase [Alphaproteobacteria bacterium]|nr:ParA family partition ATPase [Alphaproteobacteria bacterium]
MVAKIITIAQQKGGAGKTTMAAHLAVAWAASGRRKVAIIDTDPQGSLTQWHAIRAARLGEGATNLTFSAISGWRVRSEIDRLRHTHDLVIIDSPPHTDAEARTAIRAADLVVVPLQPSPMDVWATSATIQICKQERVPVKMVLNRVHPQAKLTDAISGEMVGLTANRFGNRVIFAGSLMQGYGVTEAQPNSLAAEEVRALAQEIITYLNRKAASMRASA